MAGRRPPPLSVASLMAQCQALLLPPAANSNGRFGLMAAAAPAGLASLSADVAAPPAQASGPQAGAAGTHAGLIHEPPAAALATGPVNQLFVTGCPRSGTTLLQSILAQAAGLHTLKETHFFKHLMRRRPLRWIDRHIQLDPARVQHCFNFIISHNALAAKLGVPDAAPEQAGLALYPELASIRRLDAACALLDDLLQRSAQAAGYAGWLEKSPEHLFFINDIRRHMPAARFVHILRDGPDTVASLVDAKRKYPESWGWIGNLRSTVQLYNRYARAIRHQIAARDSFILRYDDLTAQNQTVMTQLARFLGLPDGAIDLASIDTYRADVIRPDEPWKVRSERGIINTSGQKFHTLFTAHEQEFITQNIISTQDILSG